MALDDAKVTALLKDHRERLYEIIDPSPLLIAALIKLDVIDSSTKDKLDVANHSKHDKIKIILDCVNSKSTKVFLAFCMVLAQDNIGRKYIVTDEMRLDLDDVKRQYDEYDGVPNKGSAIKGQHIRKESSSKPGNETTAIRNQNSKRNTSSKRKSTEINTLGDGHLQEYQDLCPPKRKKSYNPEPMISSTGTGGGGKLHNKMGHERKDKGHSDEDEDNDNDDNDDDDDSMEHDDTDDDNISGIHMAISPVTKERPIFFQVGKGIVIDRPNPNKKELRIGLWKENKIGQLEPRDHQLYSVILDMDQLDRLRMYLPKIEKALKLCNSNLYLGFSRHLGRLLFVEVKPVLCRVDIRFMHYDPNEKDLIHGRPGLHCYYTQFMEVKRFLTKHLCDVIASLGTYKNPCRLPGHQKDSCDVCALDEKTRLNRESMEYLKTAQNQQPTSNVTSTDDVGGNIVYDEVTIKTRTEDGTETVVVLENGKVKSKTKRTAASKSSDMDV